MNRKISTLIFAGVLAVFTFSTLPAFACPNVSNGTKHEKKIEDKVEKKCKKGCTKPCCAKAKDKKCNKAKAKARPDHNDQSRYND